jgi:SAM-dependent methyltransferase
VAQNIYDDAEFFAAYSGLQRSTMGLDGAAEWSTLRDLLPDIAGSRVVDLGCGFGWFCRWAVETGAASVRGIDLSAKMLARAESDSTGSTITYERQDLETVALGNASLDLAFSSLTLHYLTDLTHLMTSVHEALVPGGRFVFSVEHPIHTAPSNPGFVTDSTTGRSVWPVDEYLHEGPRTTNWLAPGVVKHHRTIATYVSHILQAGFQLTDLVEWGPSLEQVAEVPEWSVERDRPPFLLVAARRD